VLCAGSWGCGRLGSLEQEGIGGRVAGGGQGAGWCVGVEEPGDRGGGGAVPEAGAAKHGVVAVADKDHVGTGSGSSGPLYVVGGGAGAGYLVAFAVDEDGAFVACEARPQPANR
jgi:hypothetical protein